MLYPSYRNLYDYRRITPELFPSSELLKVTSFWHDNTYADILWVKLIQSVGDNVGNEKYLDFSHHILSNITDLNPYFARAYEIDLLFTPLVYADSQDDITPEDKLKFLRAIEHGKQGMKILCNKNKIDTISNLSYGKELWWRSDLRNPCISGMIPYYIGFHYSNDFEDGKNASYYYKIASMQNNAPRSTEFLGPIAFANTTNPLDAALSFLLIARDWFDIEPYQCHALADSLMGDIKDKRTLDKDWINEIQIAEKNIAESKNLIDQKSMDSLWVNNCADSIKRWIKQVYIAYITQIAADHPDIENAQDLIKNWIIDTIPTLSTQPWYNMRKRKWRWYFKIY